MYSRLKTLFLSHQQFAHALRITLALAFTLIFYQITALPHSMWGPITVAVVMMQPHAGAIIHKGFQRIGGTLLGALLGLVTLLFPQHLPALVPLWILLGCFFLSFQAKGKYTYVFFLAGITLLIVAYQDNSQQELSVALWRVCNILIGTLIAISFSSLFPIRALTSWQRLFTENLHDLRLLYQAHASAHTPHPDALLHLRQQVMDRHLQMINLLANVQKEQHANAELYRGILATQRSLISLMEQLIETHWSSDAGRRQLLEQAELADYQQQIAQVFDLLADNARHKIVVPEIAPLRMMAGQLAKGQEQLTLGPFGYLWLTRQLIQRLQELTEQLKKLKS